MTISKLLLHGWMILVLLSAGSATAVNWDGSDSVNWSNANNWDIAPAANDPLVFSLAGQAFQPLNNDIVGGSYSGITFNANVYTNDVTGLNTHVAVTGNSFQLGASGITASGIVAGRTVEFQTPIALTGTATIAFPTASTTLQLSDQISGTGFGITKTGAGTLRLTGTNTYTGKTTLAGILEVQTLSNLGVSGPLGAPTVAGTTGEISLTGGTFRFIGSTNQATNRNYRSAGSNSTLEASGTSGAESTFNGTFTTADFSSRLGGTGIGIYNGVISSGTNSAFTKIGTGTWILGGGSNNSFGANFSITTGTVIAAKNNAFGTTNVAGGPFNVLVSNGATLGIQGGINYSQTAKGIRLIGNGDALNSRSGALDNVSGDNTLTAPIVLTGAAKIGATSGSLNLNGTFSNAGFLLTVGGVGDITKSTSGITGTGGLTKTGLGKLILAAANDYSGNTTVQQGELSITGSLNNSNVTLTGGMLSGFGSMKSLAVGAGAVVSPGLSPGTLTVLENVSFAQDTTYEWEINDWDGPPSISFDMLDITGTLAFNSTMADPFVLSLASLNGLNAPDEVPDFIDQPRQWTIATADGGITGLTMSNYFIDVTNFLNSIEGTFTLSVEDGTNLVLSYSGAPIPEPSCSWLLGLGCILLRTRRRKTPG
jgi:autotransporter-associated beta strand protein